MKLTLDNPAGMHAPFGSYSHIAEAPAGARFVFISGQVPVRPDGTCPESFAEQADQVFANIVLLLRHKGLRPTDVIKVTSYIVDADGNPGALLEARAKHFGDHRPAATGVFIKALVRPEWKLEVEVIAVAS